MALTDRFGFSRFGPGVGGSLNDDGGKFSDSDRVMLDRILAAFESHTHSDAAGGVRMPSPDAALSAVYFSTGGTLRGGKTYYYSYTVLDRYGLESAPAPVAEVVAPAPLMTPEAPQVYADGGGSLPPGVYLYGITAFGLDNKETTLSAPVPVTLLQGDGGARVALPQTTAVWGPIRYQVWRQSPVSNGWTRVGIALSNTEFIDDGSVPDDNRVCDPAHQPPQVNLTAASGSVKLTVPESVRSFLLNSSQWESRGWRLYRSEVAGTWSGQSLVAEVVATVNDAGGERVFEVTDTGSELMFGMPPLVSRCLAASAPFVTPLLPVGDALPTGARPGATLISGAAQYTYTDTGWVQSSIPVVPSLPASTRTGEVWFSGDSLHQWDGAQWLALGGGGTPGGGGRTVIPVNQPLPWTGAEGDEVLSGGVLYRFTEGVWVQAEVPVVEMLAAFNVREDAVVRDKTNGVMMRRNGSWVPAGDSFDFEALPMYLGAVRFSKSLLPFQADSSTRPEFFFKNYNNEQFQVSPDRVAFCLEAGAYLVRDDNVQFDAPSGGGWVIVPNTVTVNLFGNVLTSRDMGVETPYYVGSAL